MVYFPTLNLSFKVHPVAFELFGIDIYYYAICIVVGIVLALILCYQSKEKFGIDFDFVLESLMVAVFIGIIGARIYYIAFNWKNHDLSLNTILNIRNGGLAIYGGLLAGGFVLLRKCRKYKVNHLDFLDYIVPFVAIAQSVGRWGNFFNQEAYGSETTNILRMGINTLEGYKEVHPAFLYESIATLLIFMFLKKMQKNRKFKGQICYFYLFLYAGVKMFIEGIRMDSLMLGNFRISQILSVAIFVVSGIILLKKRKKYRYKYFQKVKC